MTTIPCFSSGQIEALAKVLGECGTGSDITRILTSLGLSDESGHSTKWRRLEWVLSEFQMRYGCANHVIRFIQAMLDPARFAGRVPEFETRQQELNVILALSGLEYGADGQFRYVSVARTLDEAERRLRTIRSKFEGRRIHPEVYRYCRAELLQDNYFHAVFEASKGLEQRLRDMTGIEESGAVLVDRVFAIERPMLALNALRTQTEKSEHKGFAALLKGCFAAIRNPLAHEPKILWDGDDDAADYFTLISLLHRKLDDCVLVRTGDTQ